MLTKICQSVCQHGASVSLQSPWLAYVTGIKQKEATLHRGSMYRVPPSLAPCAPLSRRVTQAPVASQPDVTLGVTTLGKTHAARLQQTNFRSCLLEAPGCRLSLTTLTWPGFLFRSLRLSSASRSVDFGTLVIGGVCGGYFELGCCAGVLIHLLYFSF